jgi:hypothetical protein
VVRGLNPLAATVRTPLSAPVIAATRLRGGAANTARGAASLIAEAISTAHQRPETLTRSSRYRGYREMITDLLRWIQAEDPSLGMYDEFRDDNELGLALDQLADVANAQRAPRAVWRELQVVATVMGLTAMIPIGAGRSA